MLIGAVVAVVDMIVLIQNMRELLTRFIIGLSVRPLDHPIPVDPETAEAYLPWFVSLDGLANLMAAAVVLLGLTVIACCLWLAWMVSQQRNWARIVTTVLGVGFAIGWTALLVVGSTLNVFDFSIGGTLTVMTPFLVAAPTVILLWTPQANAVFVSYNRAV